MTSPRMALAILLTFLPSLCLLTPTADARPQPKAKLSAASGKRIYTRTCASCHADQGEGIPGALPPLAASDFLNADKDRAIAIVLKGLTGVVTVNGNPYESQMPPQTLSDREVAEVLTFVYGQWGNSVKVVTPEEVKAVRARD